jgi:hypothetical protein
MYSNTRILPSRGPCDRTCLIDHCNSAHGMSVNPEPLVLNVVDTTSAHDEGTVAGRPPKHIKWDRQFTDPKRALVTTDVFLLRPRPRGLDPSATYGLLIQSVAIAPWMYKLSRLRIPRLNLVFTHSSALLDRFDNCRWIPGSGVWLGGSLAGGAVEIHAKQRLCSMVSSNKRSNDLHRFRYGTALSLRRKNPFGVDVYVSPPFVPSSETLEPYVDSICHEDYESRRDATNDNLSSAKIS